MDDETWKPLQANEGLPREMIPELWDWVRRVISSDVMPFGRVRSPDNKLILEMCTDLGITMREIEEASSSAGLKRQWAAIMRDLRMHNKPLQIADYLLAHEVSADAEALDEMLTRHELPWEVGTRINFDGLVPREEVQSESD